MLSMGKFDRKIQKELLQKLYETSPEGLDFLTNQDFESRFGGQQNYMANLKYLLGHELIVFESTSYINGPEKIHPNTLQITSKGIDFIRDDGGLGAILNVQTIKFHRDAVVVLEDLIALSNMTDPEKERAKSKLFEMTTESLKTVVQTVTTAGLAILMK